VGSVYVTVGKNKDMLPARIVVPGTENKMTYAAVYCGATSEEIEKALKAGYKLAKKLDDSSRGGSFLKDSLSEKQRTILDSIVDICYFDNPRAYQREARKAWLKRFLPAVAPSLSREQLRASLERVLASRK
jgi:hypothetical protein